MTTVYVAADFSQLESFLTAHFSGDTVMQDELDASLLPGGFKVHSLNAGLIYEIDPADAKTHKVEIQGRVTSAYKGGKKISHLTNYGGQAPLVAAQLWLDLAFAKEAHGKITDKYSITAGWREDLVRQVFGIPIYACPKCEQTFNKFTMCPVCTNKFRQVQCKYVGWEQGPTYELRTPFGRRRRYRGRPGECANPIAAQLPQSCGASIWYRTLNRLNGFEMIDGEPVEWPTPPEYKLITQPYQVLEYQNPIATGTYDSFVVECLESEVDTVAQWLAWTMEQAWPQLGGKRFPVEIGVGSNWAEADENEIEYQAFSAENPYA